MGLARTHLEKSVQEGFLPSWTSAKRSWNIHQMQKLRSIHHGVASKGAGWKLEGCRKLFLWGSYVRTTAERESTLGICHTQWGPLPDYIQNYLETFLETRFTSSQPHSNPRGSQGVWGGWTWEREGKWRTVLQRNGAEANHVLFLNMTSFRTQRKLELGVKISFKLFENWVTC